VSLAGPAVAREARVAGEIASRDRDAHPQPHAQRRPRQQAKVADADALAFVAPIHFCNFPSILKGWIDRVWTLDFAFGLTSAGWHGDVNGRIPLLHHKRVLIMTSTIFDENSYDAGIRDAIGTVIDDWGFRFPGIQDVQHVYFYAATAATADTIRGYLDQAYDLGKNFERDARPASSPAVDSADNGPTETKTR
jgi:NAD(P)H dehydrogenase (quinone)